MQTIFEKTNYEQIISRLQQINATTRPLWGKMDASQMMHHLNLTLEAPLGKYATKGKPVFIMRLFRNVLYNDKPFGKGSPTPKDFKVTGSYNFEEEKQKTLKNVREIFNKGESSVFKQHVFFGKLSTEQWGKHFYKHLDHHLRQFGV